MGTMRLASGVMKTGKSKRLSHRSRRASLGGFALNRKVVKMSNRNVVIGGLSYEEQVSALKRAAQQSVHLTALRRWLVVSIFINVILLALVLFIIGGR